jgi:imidazolonepropionase
MDIVISNIGQMVSPFERVSEENGAQGALRITRDTELCIHKGKIVDDVASRSPSQCRTIDAQGGVVMPGLVDPFWIMPHVPEWIRQQQDSVEHDVLTWTRRILRHALASGVTTVELKCPQSGGRDALLALGHLERQSRPRVRGALLVTLTDKSPDRDRRVSSLIGDIIPEIRQRRLATFVDVGWDEHGDFVSDARAVLRAASGAGLRPKLHLRANPGLSALETLAKSLDVASIGRADRIPVGLAQSLSESGIVPVYIPALEAPCEEERVDFRPWLDRGLPLAVGSGNGLRAQAPVSMWSALSAAMEAWGLTLAEAVAACTLGNARALEMEHDIGSLDAGKCADLIILRLADFRELESMLGFPPIACVIADGEIVYPS